MNASGTYHQSKHGSPPQLNGRDRQRERTDRSTEDEIGVKGSLKDQATGKTTKERDLKKRFYSDRRRQ